MGLSAVKPDIVTGEWSGEDVRRELEQILLSRVFRSSHRCQEFLRYVVTKAVEGDSKSLKERTIAVDVFGRDATGDLSDDSIVRVAAREVRKRLVQYYAEEGAKVQLRIELPPGSYVPLIHPQPLAAAPKNETEPETERTETARVSRFLARWKPLLGAALLIAASAAFAVRAIGYKRNLFDVFWQPLFDEKTPAIIAIAHPIVYLPSLRAQQLDGGRNGRPTPPIQRPIDVPADLLTGADFTPALNQYVGFGDLEAVLRISSLLAQHRAAHRLRLASRMDFNDLRGSGAVLIGAYTNRWTMDLIKNMRYRFDYDARGKPCIAEDSTGCRWTLTTKSDDGRSSEDYILLCRFPHSATKGFVVVCAGLNVYGTEEAGRMVSDPESLTPILRNLPNRWRTDNLQLVLHVAVVGDAPAQSDVVSVYTW